MRGLIAAANQDKRLSRVFSTFTASNPSIFLDIDRDKATALGVNIGGIFTALQATLGSYYVNDFNLYGRTWQVNIQGEADDRRRIDDIWQIQVRNKVGEMVPMRSIAEVRYAVGPQVMTDAVQNNHLAVEVVERAQTEVPVLQYFRDCDVAVVDAVQQGCHGGRLIQLPCSSAVMGGDGWPAAQSFGLRHLADMPRFVRHAATPVGADMLTELRRAA